LNRRIFSKKKASVKRFSEKMCESGYCGEAIVAEHA